MDGRCPIQDPKNCPEATEDGPRSWTESPRKIQTDPPVRSPRTGLKGPKKLRAQYRKLYAASAAVNFARIQDPYFGPCHTPRCIHSRPQSACLRSFMRTPTFVTSPPSCRLASETVMGALRHPDLMLHPFRASVVCQGQADQIIGAQKIPASRHPSAPLSDFGRPAPYPSSFALPDPSVSYFLCLNGPTVRSSTGQNDRTAVAIERRPELRRYPMIFGNLANFLHFIFGHGWPEEIRA